MIQRITTESRGFFGAVCVFLVVNSSCAAETIPPSLDSFALIKTIFSLLLVLGMVVLVAWLLKRTLPGYTTNSHDVRVVATIAVGVKERVVLVDVGETRLVLGVTLGQINKLHEMPRPQSSDLTNIDPSEATSFTSKLKQLMATKKENV